VIKGACGAFRFGKEGVPRDRGSEDQSGDRGELVGTSRSRVGFLMNRFRKLGFIHYNGGLQVYSSLLNVVLND
jgi:hypothetical protein